MYMKKEIWHVEPHCDSALPVCTYILISGYTVPGSSISVDMTNGALLLSRPTPLYTHSRAAGSNELILPNNADVIFLFQLNARCEIYNTR